MKKIFFVIIASLFVFCNIAFAKPRKNYFKYKTAKTYYNSNARTFSKAMRIKKYNEQKGICNHCKKHFEFSEMEGDHIVPYSKGGLTTYNNLQMLCRHCNRSKGNRYSY